MRPQCLLLIIGFVLTCVPATRGEEPGSEPAAARAAVERSLPYLERQGVAWMTEKKCASCHHVPFLIWSHTNADAAGVAVDRKKVAEWTEWSWRFSKSRRNPAATRPLEPDNDGGGLDTLSQLLLGRTDARARQSDDFAQDLSQVILRWQQPDGSWKAAGQLPRQNRPESETHAVTTRWTIVALSTVEPSDPPTQKALARAMQSLKVPESPASNEWLVCSLLCQHAEGKPNRTAELVDQLLRRQNEDGGWAWRTGGASDAFATGQVLYALGQCDAVASREPARRARQYLIKSQQPDGSWQVPPQNISAASNELRLKKLVPIYQYWGTAWAAIGLSQTIDSRHRSSGSSER